MVAEDNPDKKGGIWVMDRQLGQPIDVETKKVKETPTNKEYSSTILLQLAFQSLGVVYGDLGTSPLYVFDNTFPDGIVHKEDVVGALTVIICLLSVEKMTMIKPSSYWYFSLRRNNMALAKFGFCLHQYIVLIWLLLIGGIGIFNIFKYDRSILEAFSPVYMYILRGEVDFWWESLGGIMLSINGTETFFPDLNHFPVLSLQIAFTVVVFPCLLLAYCGQAAYLMKNSNNAASAF